MLKLIEAQISPYHLGYRKATRTTRAELLAHIGVGPGNASCARRAGDVCDTLVVSIDPSARPYRLPDEFQDFPVVYQKRVQS